MLEMAGGILVDVEISVNIRYGYDIRGEVVGEDGTAALGEPSPGARSGGPGRRPTPVPADWRERFIARLRRRAPGVGRRGRRRRRAVGPSAWDGYAAAVVSDAGRGRRCAPASGCR